MGEKIFKTRGTRTSYPSDVSDEEWEFCAPYLTLMKEEALQREYTMRALFNVVRYMVRAGCPWRMIPNDLPRGKQCINRHSAGSRQDASKRWDMICVRCCGCLQSRKKSLPR